MSKLEELISELCPDGVEYKTLDQIAENHDNERKPISSGNRESGQYPYYGASGIVDYVKNYIFDGDFLLISEDGANLIARNTPIAFSVSGKNWVNNHAHILRFDSIITQKFVEHYLESLDLTAFISGAAQPKLNQKNLNKIPIPFPPLSVQSEIVRILDNFTELTAELTAELTVRKKQYEYYKNKLFNGANDIQMVTLDMISENCDAQRKPVTSGNRETGNIPYYGASGIVDYVKDYIYDGDYLLISEDGANLLARTTPVAFSVSGKTWVNNHAHVMKFEEYATRRYVEMYINSINLSYYITGAAQPKLNQKNLNKIEIPLPPLAEQQRIVDILDRFDTLCNDISTGLPAEIEARTKQYEYYRNKLLTFKELS